MNVLSTSQPLWWQRGVIYQVYPRSFKDTNGDGIGDLAGVIDGLDYLRGTLGVDAIWLSPFYPSPMKDFGYDVSDFTDVSPLFGDLATFDRLVAEAHARGVKVLVDYVPNHSSDLHPWFQASRSSRDNPYRDWYYWRDPKPDGSPPNNWLAVFGGRAWEWDEGSGQYYLHSFLREQPDLNWRNPAVQQAMFEVLRFWLDRGVDGFRIDALAFAMKDPEMRDNPPNPASTSRLHKEMGDYDSQIHQHELGHPDLHRLLRDLRRFMDDYSAAHNRALVTVGELHIFDWPELARYYGASLDELHLPFNFGLLNAHWAARAVRETVDGYSAALPEGAWPNFVLGNHDESRIATRVGPVQARLALMLLLTLRGTPTMYYGDELGMQDVPIPPERMQDPWGINVPGKNLSRDPARTPMPWTPGPNAGFTAPGVEPWLPIGAEATEVNVASELADPRSMLSLTRQLLALRRASPALSEGRYQPLNQSGIPVDCYVYLREQGGERFLVALNFSEQDQTVRLEGLDRGTLVLSTLLDRNGAVDLGRFALRPAEGWVLRLE